MVGENKPRRMDGPGRRVVRPRNIPARDFQKPDAIQPSDFVYKEIDTPTIIETPRPAQSKPTNWRKRVTIGVAIVTIAVIGVVGFKAVMAGQKVITRNANSGAPALAGEIDPNKLRGEGDGRINILLLGIGGPGHEAPNLSDTIMVASIDPRTKDIAMLSIPRDFYAKIPGHGSTKINAANSYGESPKNPGGGAALAKETVSQILDIPIHYYIRTDFAAFKQAVDAVGGVDVDVKKAIYDPEYPCDRNRGYCPFRIAAGKQHMNGSLALQYARSRKGTGGGDFDRAARQQEVLIALQKKSLQLSTLTNPAKIIGLMDAAGSHISTDFQPNEIKKMAELIKEIDMSKSATRVLDTSAEGLLQMGNIPGAGSTVVPRAGLYNYSEIRELVHSIFSDGYLKEEAAKLEIQNGTLKDGLANTVAQTLKAYKYSVVAITTADRQDYAKTVIYDYTNGRKPYTIRYLEKRFKVTAQKMPQPSAAPGAPTIDVRVIVGNEYKP